MIENDLLNQMDLLGLTVSGKKHGRDGGKKKKCCGGKPLEDGYLCCGETPYKSSPKKGLANNEGRKCCRDEKIGEYQLK